jgi:hypothetical protein
MASITPETYAEIAQLLQSNPAFTSHIDMDALLLEMERVTGKSYSQFTHKPEPRPVETERQENDLTRLIKLMKMTTSSNSAEALVAVRKANEELKRLGWDWESILAGKIKIIENPFTTLKRPPTGGISRAGTIPTRPAPQPAYDPFDCDDGDVKGYTSPPPPQAKPPVLSSDPTRFDGNCYCCGKFVVKGTAYLFTPYNFNRGATISRVPICTSCNTTLSLNIPTNAARKQRPARSTSIDDL